jgi:glyoxylase-like metal-dependent hydrolase (beta-lactamase superfamily II)
MATETAEKEVTAREPEHRGAFTIPGPLPIQSAAPDLPVHPVKRNTLPSSKGGGSVGQIWFIRDNIWGTVFIEGKEGVVAFDTMHSPASAREYRGVVERVSRGKKPHTIVYTHQDLDHCGYAADFAPDADEIIMHELAADVMNAGICDGQLPPTQIMRGNRQEYEIDGVEFELIYPGPTHSTGNVSVYFPRDKVIYSCDTIISGSMYMFLPYWHPTQFVPSMRRLMALDWDIFIPSHIFQLDRKDVEEHLTLWEIFLDAAQRAFADGVDPYNPTEVTNYAQKTLGAEYGHLFRWDEHCALNLVRLMQHYLTGGWGVEGNVPANAGALQ